MSPRRSASSTNSSGAAARPARPGRVARAARARRARRRAAAAVEPGGELERAAPAPCAGVRSAVDERATAGRRPARCVADAAAPSRRSAAGWKTLREIASHELDLAAQLNEHRRDAVRLRARRRGEPVGDLALHHHGTRATTCGSSSIVCRIAGHGDAVGQVRDHLGRRGPSAPGRRPSRPRSAGRVRVSGERVMQHRLEPPVGLDHVQVCRRAGRGMRSGRRGPPPISSTTSSVGELGRAADHVEDVVVDEEVLAQLAVRADLEAAPAARGSRAPHARGAHHSKSRAALRSRSARSLS